MPTLCYLKGVQSIGACRVCLVEIEGARTLVASCSQPAADGMVVKTSTPRVRRARKTVLELLLSEHDGNCQTCTRSDDCELRQLALEMGIFEIPSGARPRRSSMSPRRRCSVTAASAYRAVVASPSATRSRAWAASSPRTVVSRP